MTMTASDIRNATWIKSSYSNGNGGNCVEWAPSVAMARDVVPVRDSKTPAVVAVFPPRSWARFVAAARDGQFQDRQG